VVSTNRELSQRYSVKVSFSVKVSGTYTSSRIGFSGMFIKNIPKFCIRPQSETPRDRNRGLYFNLRLP
jgi:hypothetical protein